MIEKNENRKNWIRYFCSKFCIFYKNFGESFNKIEKYTDPFFIKNKKEEILERAKNKLDFKFLGKITTVHLITKTLGNMTALIRIKQSFNKLCAQGTPNFQ